MEGPCVADEAERAASRVRLARKQPALRRPSTAQRRSSHLREDPVRRAQPSPLFASRAGPVRVFVTRTDYRQDGMLPVTLYTVHGGGHTIPGPRQAPFVLGRTTRDLNAAEAIGQFFGLMLPPEPPKIR